MDSLKVLQVLRLPILALQTLLHTDLQFPPQLLPAVPAAQAPRIDHLHPRTTHPLGLLLGPLAVRIATRSALQAVTVLHYTARMPHPSKGSQLEGS